VKFNTGAYSTTSYGECWQGGSCIVTPQVLDGFCPPVSDADSNVNIGLIIGIVVGVIVVIAIVIGICIYRRRQARLKIRLLGFPILTVK
jgi:hypothetical protein